MLDIPKLKLCNCEESLAFAMKNLISEKKYRFADINAKLAALNPMAVISRGYGAVFDKDNKIVKMVEDINIGDEISIKISNGEINATVSKVKRRRNNAKKGS